MAEGMWICGLSMEMELAEEMGWVGKCIGCHHFDSYNGLYCHKKNKRLTKEQENCKDWLVNHR